MAIYTVHIPRSGEAERAVFVRDGFSMAAFLFGPLWLFTRGGWISGSGLLVAIAISLSGLAASGLQGEYLAGLCFFLMLLIGLEGSSLLRLDLSIRGHRHAGVVAGIHRDDAEARFFASLPSASLPAISPPLFPPAQQEGQTAQAGAPRSGIIGSFPLPSGTRASS